MAKERIVILGGGVAALTTAWELTRDPAWRDRYEITVYQMGWRLGGKGASGRNPERAQRIEEHGLHVFFGFYENAFRMLREVYEELDRKPDAPLARWDAAFKPHDFVAITDRVADESIVWPLHFPRRKNAPGDGEPPPSTWEVLRLVLEFNVDYLEDWLLSNNRALALLPTPAAEVLRNWRRRLEKAFDHDADGRVLDDVLLRVPWFTGGIRAVHEFTSQVFDDTRQPDGIVERLLKNTVGRFLPDVMDQITGAWFTLQASHILAKRLDDDPLAISATDLNRLATMLDGVRGAARAALERRARTEPPIYRLLVVIDLSTTTLIGLIRDNLLTPPVDWFSIDDEEIHDWLARHGATETTIRSGPVRALMDTAFSRPCGLGAGTFLQCAVLILFGYKGSVMWKMQAGMGDVVFAPLYQVLSRRGVQFRFFHRLDALRLSEPDRYGHRTISTIEIGRQVTPRGTYSPLVTVEGLPCWPDRPLYDQLEEGKALERFSLDAGDEHKTLENWWTAWRDTRNPLILKAGRDFDRVVLGVSVGILPYVARDLMDDPGNPRFRDMVERVKTTETQAMQLWFSNSLDEKGWHLPSPVLTAFDEPFDTWMDASQVLAREQWHGKARSLAYLCSPNDGVDHTHLPPRSDHGYSITRHQQVKAKGRTWCDASARTLWPGAAGGDGALDYATLAAPGATNAEDRWNAQYWIGVWNPSDRYVLSPAGSNRYRLRAEQSGYSNLTLAGDWLKTSLSAGCAEAAVMSGMHAARAVSGYPRAIPGDWLPPPEHGIPVPYVLRPGDMLGLPPYRQEGVDMYSFFLAAEAEALNAMCTRYLNFGPVTYRPFLDKVMLVAAETERTYSAPFGWVPEKDYAFWVPLVAGFETATGFVSRRVVWFQPFVWVDSSVAVRAGREVYGFNKSLAEIIGSPRQETAGSDATFSGFTLKTRVARTLGTEDEATVEELLSLTGHNTHSTQHLTPDLPSLEFLQRYVASQLAEEDCPATLRALSLLIGDLRRGKVRMVFLKEFPAPRIDHQASYAAVVETTARVIGGLTADLLGETYTLRVAPYQSHPIVETLGLKGGVADDGTFTTTTLAQFRIHMDFEVGDGDIIVERKP